MNIINENSSNIEAKEMIPLSRSGGIKIYQYIVLPLTIWFAAKSRSKQFFAVEVFLFLDQAGS